MEKKVERTSKKSLKRPNLGCMQKKLMMPCGGKKYSGHNQVVFTDFYLQKFKRDQHAHQLIRSIKAVGLLLSQR